MNHILVASPDAGLLAQISDRMRLEGYVPHEAVEPMGVMLNAVACDLVLMDEALDPEGALAGALRRDHPELPLMVMARGAGAQSQLSFDVDARVDVEGLPMDSLQAAAVSLLRHSPRAPEAEIIDTPHGHVDLGAHLVEGLEGATEPLTELEGRIVAYLYARKGRPVSRRELLAEVWGVNEEMQTRTVDVVIGKLRRKLERNPEAPALIVTVKGTGYAWRP